jgi:Zn-dependent M28 family amino/carboxypeptidase
MGKETYFPGANDNASGVGMLLYLAQELSLKRDSNFNYVFIAFGAEEAGLVGSHYFVEHPLFDLKKIRFLLNTDIMGSGEEGITVVNATLFKTEFEKLTQINLEANYLTQVKSRGPAANSDHYFFTEKGVPAFFVYTMGPNKHYHDIQDTAEELSYAAFEPLAKLLLAFIGSF